MVGTSEEVARAVTDVHAARFLRSRKKSPTVLFGPLEIPASKSSPLFHVLVTIIVVTEWPSRIPIVLCHERWIKKSSQSWHTYRGDQLCIDLDERWANQIHLAAHVLPQNKVPMYAAEYLINSTCSLIQRHRIGFELALPTWPSTWDDWPHGPAGAEQYYNDSNG